MAPGQCLTWSVFYCSVRCYFRAGLSWLVQNSWHLEGKPRQTWMKNGMPGTDVIVKKGRSSYTQQSCLCVFLSRSMDKQRSKRPVSASQSQDVASQSQDVASHYLLNQGPSQSNTPVMRRERQRNPDRQRALSAFSLAASVGLPCPFSSPGTSSSTSLDWQVCLSVCLAVCPAECPVMHSVSKFLCCLYLTR